MNTSEEDENKMSENTKESELKGKRSLTLYQPLAMQLAPVAYLCFHKSIVARRGKNCNYTLLSNFENLEWRLA